MPLALPGSASAAKRPPIIETLTFTGGETPGTVLIEAWIADARSVTARVGDQRVPMTAMERRRRTAGWTAEIGETTERCLPVKIKARNAAGTSARRQQVCVFGPAEPEPPSMTPDI